jgi:hypothetical protein
MQVIASSNGKEDWALFNTGSKKGHHLEVLKPSR